MNPSDYNPSNPQVFSRPNFIRLLTAALDSRAYRFARQAALNWLAVFPGDLTIQLYLGKSHLAEGKLVQAQPIVEKIVRFDPEFLEAQEILANIYEKVESDRLAVKKTEALLLGSESFDLQGQPDWFTWHRAARQAIQAENWSEASHLLHQVTSVVPDSCLAAIDQLNACWHINDRASVYQLTNLYHERWPDCLQFSLKLAEVEIEFGNEISAVGLLHQCVANDAVGQVAQRLWGQDHRYQPLWPGGLEIFLDLPVPAEVAFLLGWNRLPSGTILPSTPEVDTPLEAGNVEETTFQPAPNVRPVLESLPAEPAEPAADQDESLKVVEESFAKLAKQVKRPSLSRSDGRYPVYVIFSTAQGLDNQYGPQTRNVLTKEMQQLADYVAKRPGWNSMVFFPDDKEIANRYGTNLVNGLDPWKLKLSLADLDQALTKKGQMIGAVLIVGGHEVVPYHLLPNPTSDIDREVPSDNPYSTLDSNYFIPEWPVGRLPGEAGKDAGLLLAQLRNLNQSHQKRAKNVPQWGDLLAFLLNFLRQLAAARKQSGFGYTASVWKESSNLVFKAMSDTGNLVVCPPDSFQSIVNEQLLKSPLDYFNLHGLVDGAEWYGQKDANDTYSTLDFPVALSPKNLVKNGTSPQIVYSEACYGAHVQEKSEDQSLALKFLSIGTRAFVGSTTISYGSVTSPLIGADLLGYHFWKLLRDGLTVGEALMQAKQALAKEMNQRQGFLDGEDQKTLISFILFGDPLAGFDGVTSQGKNYLRFKNHPTLKTISDYVPAEKASPEVSARVLREVKSVVERYLPGLDNAMFEVAEQQEQTMGKDGHSHPVESLPKSGNPGSSAGVVVTVSKSVVVARRTFRQYARVTLNNNGKMVKLAVSR